MFWKYSVVSVAMVEYVNPSIILTSFPTGTVQGPVEEPPMLIQRPAFCRPPYAQWGIGQGAARLLVRVESTFIFC